MKKLWSIGVVGLVLTWLLVMGPSPAGAYYPPLQITATIGNEGSGITLTVNDPENGTVSKTYPNFKGVLFHRNNYGIVAWESETVFPGSNDPAFNANYATYDPFRKTFQVETQGPFLQPGQIKVGDGVVAFVPWVDPNNFFGEFRYSTYDPVKGAWQNRSWVPNSIYDKTYGLYIQTKEGVVVCKYIWEVALFSSQHYEADVDIYDASAGKWSSEMGAGAPDVVYNDAFQFTTEIKNGTVYITWFPMEEVTLKDFHGYDAGKQAWYNGPTKPVPHFAAQPNSGPNPLWVWFTDLSIGASSIKWSFGDGASDTKRSTYHEYTKDGVYLSEQKITAPGNSTRYQNIYVGVSPPTWLSSYASMASADDLTMLRRYRDEVLSKDPRGKVYKDQLYANSEAALTVLTDNPELLLRARNLVDANMGAVIQILQGHEGYIYDPDEVLAFLEAYENLAPPQLKALINVVRKELRQSQLEVKPFLGFRLGSDGPQQKNNSRKAPKN
jgi:PKD repeat protein